MTFQDEKTFFRGLGPNKPTWLTMTQWKVLQRYFSYENPNISQVLNEMAVQLMGGARIRTKDQGYAAASEAFKSGRKRLGEQIDLQDLDLAQRPATSTARTSEVRPPYWTYDRD